MPTLAENIIPRRKLLLMTSETVIFSSIVLLGTSLPPLAAPDASLDFAHPDAWRGLLSSFLIAVIAQVSLSYNDLYDWRVAQNRAELPNRLMHSAGWALLMMAIGVLVVPGLFVFPGLAERGLTWRLIVLLGVAFVVILGWRRAFHWFFYRWNFGERILILGSGPQGRGIVRLIRQHPFAGFEVRGLIKAPKDPETDPVANQAAPVDERVIGDAAHLPQLAAQERVSRVVVALEERRGAVPVTELLACRISGVLVEEKESMYERVAGKLALQSLRPSYLIYGRGFVKHPVNLGAKRGIDIVVATVGLVLSAPICLLTAVLIKLDSRGPVLFMQDRVGEHGAVFRVIKFRTMRSDAEATSGPVWAKTGDDRVTRIGRFLRLSRIDEIPQMVNVLAGKMSFVGPRPERPFFVEQLSMEIPFYRLRHTVKPGLTGWAQVNHPYGASVDDAAEKLRYDLYYIKHVSPMFDLNIILRTVGVILFGKGAR